MLCRSSAIAEGVADQFRESRHLAQRFPVDFPPARGLTLENMPRPVGSSAGRPGATLAYDAALRYCAGGCETWRN
jgi:hypothetical protein